MTYISSVLTTLADIMAGHSPALLTGIHFKPPAMAPGDIYPAFDPLMAKPVSRPCCALTVPSLTPFLNAADLPGHQYGGDDNYGYVYTKHGGVVDLAHVRDLADNTRYLAAKAYFGLKLGDNFAMENDFGGVPTVKFKPTGADPSYALAACLGARIAYELGIWHEIATWFSTAGAVPQRMSSFSPEDNFSNLLGAYIGFNAVLMRNTNYNDAIDAVLPDTLNKLGLMDNSVTQNVMDYLKDHWFVEATLPINLGETKRRHMQAWPAVTPWLVTDVPVPGKNSKLTWLRSQCGGRPPAVVIHVPERFADGSRSTLLSTYYVLEVGIGTADLDSFLSAAPNPISKPVLAASFPAMIEKLRGQVVATYANGDKPF